MYTNKRFHKISIPILYCPGFVVSRVCRVQGLSCPGFVCPGFVCPGFVCPAPSLIVAFRKQNEIISLWKRASSQLEKLSPWEVSHFMLPFSYWLWLTASKRQTNAILNKIMDLFHNEIISFCHWKATIRLASEFVGVSIFQHTGKKNEYTKIHLKGKCQEMIIAMSPWSSSLGLNLWSRTLFSA
jgi:hypothetical protein